MKRRKNGEGSYGQKVMRGKTYKYYRYPNGKYIYALTAKELENKMRVYKESLEQVNVEIDNTRNLATFIELSEEWLPTTRRKLSDGVYDDYENIIRVRIKNYKAYDIANKQIKSLTPTMFTNYFFSLGEKYSKGSITKTWAIIRQILRYGKEEGYINKDFRIEKIELPSEDKVEVKQKDVLFIDKEDMERLYKECMKEDKYGDISKLIAFIMYSGLRINEATGLNWKNVDNNLSQITIKQSSKRIIERDADGNPIKNEDGTNKHKSIIKTPKTESGVRTVPLPKRAREILQYFKDKRVNDIVFITSNNTRFSSSNARKTLARILANSNCVCKDYTLHSLRHGYGSILISEGVDIKIVSKLLGHKKISTTYDIYIGVLKKDEISAINRVFG